MQLVGLASTPQQLQHIAELNRIQQASKTEEGHKAVQTLLEAAQTASSGDTAGAQRILNSNHMGLNQTFGDNFVQHVKSLVGQGKFQEANKLVQSAIAASGLVPTENLSTLYPRQQQQQGLTEYQKQNLALQNRRLDIEAGKEAKIAERQKEEINLRGQVKTAVAVSKDKTATSAARDQANNFLNLPPVLQQQWYGSIGPQVGETYQTTLTSGRTTLATIDRAKNNLTQLKNVSGTKQLAEIKRTFADLMGYFGISPNQASVLLDSSGERREQLARQVLKGVKNLNQHQFDSVLRGFDAHSIEGARAGLDSMEALTREQMKQAYDVGQRSGALYQKGYEKDIQGDGESTPPTDIQALVDKYK